jgi:hypothetical protein
MKINNKIFYLKTQHIYTSIEDSEVVLVLKRNSAGVTELSSFVSTDK